MYNAMIMSDLQFIANPFVVRSFSNETLGVSFLLALLGEENEAVRT
jgi:hypothetical protein